MNNDLDRNQNNNLTNNESPTLPNAENVKDQQTSMESSAAMGPSFDKSMDKNKAFKYAVFYVIISVIAIFAGIYIFGQGLSNRGDNFGNYSVFLATGFLSIGVMYISLLLAESMIIQYKKGRYHFISQAVKNSPKAAFYAAIAVVIFLTLLWGSDRPITIFTLLLSPVAAFASALEIINEESVRRYAINMSITDGKIEKKHALLYTIIYIILCLLVPVFFAIVVFDSRDVLYAGAGLASLVEAIFPIAAMIIGIFICISIYWYQSGRYWIANYLVKNGKLVNSFFTAIIFYTIMYFLSPSADMEDKYSIIWLPISLMFLFFKFIALISPLVALAYVSWITASCYIGGRRIKSIEENVEKRHLDYAEHYENQPLSYKWIKPMIIAIIAILVLLAILITLLIVIG
jgi:membrane protein